MSNRENKETTNEVAQQTKTKYAVVKNGVEENIEVERGEKFTYLDVKGKDMKKINIA